MFLEKSYTDEIYGSFFLGISKSTQISLIQGLEKVKNDKVALKFYLASCVRGCEVMEAYAWAWLNVFKSSNHHE